VDVANVILVLHHYINKATRKAFFFGSYRGCHLPFLLVFTLSVFFNKYKKIVLRTKPMRPLARGLAQHGGPPGWLEESNPAGCDFLRDGRSIPPALTDHSCPGMGLIY
jgi:hypothetical protein